MINLLQDRQLVVDGPTKDGVLRANVEQEFVATPLLGNFVVDDELRTSLPQSQWYLRSHRER